MSNIILGAKYHSRPRDERALLGTQKGTSALKVRGLLENKSPKGKRKEDYEMFKDNGKRRIRRNEI